MMNMSKDVEGDRKSVRNFKRAVVWCDTAVAADFVSPLSRLPNITVSDTGSSRYRSGRFFGVYEWLFKSNKSGTAEFISVS